MASSEEKLIKIVVKTPQLKEIIEINENAKVEELKNLVSVKFNADLERLNLIFAGKILKNNETLNQHKISDGLTIHLVIRPVKKPESEDVSTTSQTTNPTTTTSTTTPTSNTNTNPINTGNLFNMFGMGDIEGMSRNILGNPEALSSLLDNSFFQSMLTNPDLIRSMVNSNPQMQQLIERNPELNHLLNNEETLRNTINIMRNPAALQELTRSQDRAMSNLESIPGGYNALQRMYTELQEPIMNATMDQFGDNPFANFARQNTNNSSTTNTQSGTENRDPLPNPWSRDSNSTSASSQPNFPNPFSDSSSFGNMNLQNILSQFTRNRDTSGNSNVQEEMSNFLNQAFQNLQRPEIRNALSNPETIEAMLQISRGYEQLQRVAPELLNSFMLGGANRSCPLTTNPSNITSSTANTTTSITTTGTNTTTTTSTTPSTTSPNVSDLYQLMSQMITDNSSNRGTQPPAEERFRTQLEQLNSMGFTDRQQNINALTETFGDVNAAIEKLLQTRNYFS